MRERRGVSPAWRTRLVAGAAGAVLAVTASPVHAQDDEESGAENICDLHDRRLEGASGIVASQDGGGWWIVTNGANQDDTLSIMRVGEDCSVRESEESWIQHTPRDPRALTFDTDGYLWVGDTGEALDRPSIAVNQVMPGDEANAAIYRYVFPEAAEEVEAFVVQPEEDLPLFFTSADGETTIYRPTGDNQVEDTPMESAGTLTLSEGGSVTGAALNADGTKAAIRTANAVYEWTVEDGDVAGALTGAEPVVTPLADEGEAQGITYDADGNFVTLSQVDSEGSYGSLHRYTPATPSSDEEAADEGGGEEADGEEDEGGSIVDFILDLGFDTIVKILAAIAVVGFLVMIGGILAIRKSRRERADTEEDDDDQMGFAAEESVFGGDADDDPVDIGLDTGQPDPEVGRLARQQGGAVYGAPKAEPTGNVYGAKRPEPTGNVYGGAKPEATGSVYGAPAPERPPEPAAPVPGGRSEPQYGAFEGAGQGSVYSDVGESFAVDPPLDSAYGVPPQSGGAVYGAEPPVPGYGGPHGAGGGRASNVEATGTVYGGSRPPESNEGHWGPPDGGDRRR